MKIIKVPEKELNNLYETHFFFGKSYRGKDIVLGVNHPPIEPERALYILNAKFGKWNGYIDNYKVTFEYIFKTDIYDNIYFTIYDYKGCMSCGMGIPKDLEVTKEGAEKINKTLAALLREIYQDVRIYDYEFGIKGWRR